MNSNICTNCGGSVELQGGSPHCPFCGFIASDNLPPKAQKKLEAAFLLLRESNFDEAKKAFEAVIQKHPDNAEAYFGRVRARYHIKYVMTADGKAVPTCSTRSGANILEDVDYKKAMEHGGEEYRAFLQENAKAVKKFCTDNASSKNTAFKFTLGDIDPTDEYHVKPQTSKKPIILSVSLSCIVIFMIVGFATGLFHRHTPGAEATCTRAQICTKCEEVITPALGHKPGAEATCTESQNCAVCNAELAKALGHKPGEEATCTEAQTCSVCNTELAAALGHTPGAEATCTNAQTCTVCNAELAAALGHTPGAGVTCTEAQTCSVCNAELVAALGHTPGAEATCTNAQTCSVCNAELAAALGHNPGALPTCTEAQTCTVCNEELVAAPGHKPGAEATCTDAQICTVCDVQLAAALGHTPGAAATCTDSQTCTVCNAELATALGHTQGEWVTVKPATNMENGLKEQCCTVCGSVLNSETIPATSETPTYSAGLAFTDNGDGTWTVSGIGTCTDTDIIIPSAYNGGAVTAIGDSAFDSCITLASITIPESITNIGSGAFCGCNALTAITVDRNNQNYFSADGILFNKNITEILCYPAGKTESVYTVPSGIWRIGPYAFSECTSLTTVTIGQGVADIAAQAFSDCNSLSKVSLPESLMTVNTESFYACSALSEIQYNSTMVDWKTRVLFGINWNQNTSEYIVYCTDGTVAKDGTVSSYPSEGPTYSAGLIFSDNGDGTWTVSSIGVCTDTNILIPPTYNGGAVTAIGDSAFVRCGITSIVIPDSITSIGSWAFSQTNLTSIVIPDSVTSIGERAFCNCSALTSVTVGAGVTSLGTCVLENCDSLVSIIVNENNLYYCSEDGILFNKEKTVLIQYPIGISSTSYTVPNTVTTIEAYAFKGCNNLTAMGMYDSVINIGEGAFMNNAFLQYMILSNNITTIGNAAFMGCSALTSVAIPHGVTVINAQIFSGCTSLSTVTLGDSVTTIGMAAFDSCTALTNITVPVSVTSMNDSVFQNCNNLTSVKIWGTVSNIGRNMFFNCVNLTTVDISGSVTNIGAYAFHNCANLTALNYDGQTEMWLAITLGEGWNASTGNYTVYCIDGTVSKDGAVTSDPTVPTYSEGLAFTQNADGTWTVSGIGTCTDTDIIIPPTYNGGAVTAIGESAFYYYSNLKSVSIPSSITNISQNAFNHSNILTSISVDEDNQYYSSDQGVLFNKNMTELILYPAGKTERTYEIPDSVTDIGRVAFFHCQNLMFLTVSENVTTIGNGAFVECHSLLSVTIGKSVTLIDNSAFDGCDKIIEVINKSNLVFTQGDTSHGYVAYYAKEIHNGESNIHNRDGYLFYTHEGIHYLVGYLGNETELVLPADYNGESYELYRGAFKHFSHLKNVVLSDGVTSIGYQAFLNCSGLTTVTIGKHLTSIGSYALLSCSGLTEIRYNGTTSQWLSLTFLDGWDNNTGDYTIYCTDGTISKDGVVTPSNPNPGTPDEEDHTHDYAETDWEEATCTSDGYTTYTCTVCGDSYDVPVTSTGHSYYESGSMDPTCTSDGYVTETCSACGDSYDTTVPSTGHDYYQSDSVEPTCTENGYVTETCSICGDSYDTPIPSTGHSYYESGSSEPSCTSDGYVTYTCSGCGDSYEDVIPGGGHSYDSYDDGYSITYTCSGCGDSYTDVYGYPEDDYYPDEEE